MPIPTPHQKIRRAAGLILFATAPLAAALFTSCKSATSPPQPLTAPTHVVATALSPTSVRLTFDAVDGATGYRVQRLCECTYWETAGETSTPSFTDTGLSPAAQHYYRVAALRGETAGPFSDSVSVATPPAG